ncbi:MAG: ATP-binding cassette subfamily B protein [Myxococcota bacterium]|jgi:ATP-binding cassette subfamily B protein
MSPPPEPASNPPQGLGVFRHSPRGLKLVWETSRGLTLTLAFLTIIGGLMPAAVAYVGKLIVDAVIAAGISESPEDRWIAIKWVILEAGLIIIMAAAQKGYTVAQSLLRALLGQHVNVLILEKALTLDLAQFEDADFYDMLSRARREASSRPLSLVNRTFSIVQNTIAMVTFGGLLLAFSPWAVLILIVASIPAFIAETRFSDAAFRLFRWRTPETRQRAYYETAIAREDFAKETQLFGLGPLFLERYRAIFHKVYAEDRRLTVRRGLWGFLLGLLSTAAFYGAYVWIAIAAIEKSITLGEMTMYLMIFKQGQTAFSSVLQAIGGMYEDNLYLSNLFDYLAHPTTTAGGILTAGVSPDDGLRFENVTFTYPGSKTPAVEDVSFQIRPGEKLALVGQNGSGKTTLIKLLAGLYKPDSGRILLHGSDIRDWDGDTLRTRLGIIFQDFVRYQLKVGENIGVGDVSRLESREGWLEAAQKAEAQDFVAALPEGYDTQLGRWFANGRELSGGQWQRIALARAFMRRDADVLVLDEPTAAMDPDAEARVFQHFQEHTSSQMAILISHRFATVRRADRIVVLEQGKVIESGTHAALMAEKGRYQHLFTLQAAGYR